MFASHTDWVTGLAVAAGRIMASSSNDGTLKLWDLAAADTASGGLPGRRPGGEHQTAAEEEEQEGYAGLAGGLGGLGGGGGVVQEKPRELLEKKTEMVTVAGESFVGIMERESESEVCMVVMMMRSSGQ